MIHAPIPIFFFWMFISLNSLTLTEKTVQYHSEVGNGFKNVNTVGYHILKQPVITNKQTKSCGLTYHEGHDATTPTFAWGWVGEEETLFEFLLIWCIIRFEEFDPPAKNQGTLSWPTVVCLGPLPHIIQLHEMNIFWHTCKNIYLLQQYSF